MEEWPYAQTKSFKRIVLHDRFGLDYCSSSVLLKAKLTKLMSLELFIAFPAVPVYPQYFVVKPFWSKRKYLFWLTEMHRFVSMCSSLVIIRQQRSQAMAEHRVFHWKQHFIRIRCGDTGLLAYWITLLMSISSDLGYFQRNLCFTKIVLLYLQNEYIQHRHLLCPLNFSALIYLNRTPHSSTRRLSTPIQKWLDISNNLKVIFQKCCWSIYTPIHYC